MKNLKDSKVISLVQAPPDKELKIIEVTGGHGLRRRLLSMGFHKGDVVMLDSRSLLGGPLLIRNLTASTSLALGRGVAQKILVEIIVK
ncbi:MAG: FeoA family protein [Acidobacteriota bacterium]